MEASYRIPPVLDLARPLSDGRVVLRGRARPGDAVRLATSAGEVLNTRADQGGVWTVIAPSSAKVRLFGLSMTGAGRAVQAQGYIAITPGGEAVQLRAGAGALVLGGPATRLRILAVDFDRQGGAVVSGVGDPGVEVEVGVDGLGRGHARINARHRFEIALNEPLSPGEHELSLSAVGRPVQSRETITASTGEPPAGQAFAATPDPGGWRIDWLTPGGGIQTTLLIARRQEGAG